jgi:WD40 repeat protein
LRHQSGVNAIAFSPDGQLVATGGADNVARVWNAHTGEPVTPPLRHLHWVVKLAFSPDSRRLLTASFDLTARVWDARSGQSITPPLRHSSNIFDAAFDASGTAIITGCEDGSVRVWDLPPAMQPVADLEKLAQVLAAHQLDSSVGIMPLPPGTLSNHWQYLQPKRAAR